MSSLASLDFRLDEWEVDVAVSGSQKGLMVPPGLAFNAVSEKALKASNKKYEAYIYPDVNHGFHNDTTPRYDKQAAELAWGRTLAFFKERLG